MSAFTPGPWEVFWIASSAGTSARITTVRTPQSAAKDVAHIPRDWNAAGDGPLIAAAPELYEALRAIMNAAIDADPKNPLALIVEKFAHAALAKAHIETQP